MDNVNALETRSGEFVYNTIYEQYGGDLEGYGNKISRRRFRKSEGIYEYDAGTTCYI